MFSPVPIQTTLGFFGSTVTQPIEYDPSRSKIGVQVVALLVVFHTTPEATAIDLVGYQRRVGGLNQVATVLSELAERLDAKRLVAAAETAPLPWA